MLHPVQLYGFISSSYKTLRHDHRKDWREMITLMLQYKDLHSLLKMAKCLWNIQYLQKYFLQGEEKWYHDGIKRHLTTIRNNNTYIWYKKRIRANVSREINWMKIEKYFFRTFNFLFFNFEGESEMYTFQHQIGIPIYLEWKIGIQILMKWHIPLKKIRACVCFFHNVIAFIYFS